MTEVQRTPYQWVVILSVSIMAFGANFIHFQLAGLAPQVFTATGASPQEFGLLMGLPLLACAIFSIPAGTLGDRFGVKPVVSAAFIVGLIGAIGRYLSEPTVGNYLLWMFFIGCALAGLNSNFIKILGVWLPPQRIGLAVGFYLAGIGLGQTAGMAMGASFETLGPPFALSIFMSGLSLVILIFLKTSPAGASRPESQPVLRNLMYVASKPAVWFGGISIFFMLGSYVALNGFLVNFLIEVKQVEAASASISSSVVAFSLMLGSLFASTLARLTGRSRVFLVLCGIISAASVYMVCTLPFSQATIVFLCLSGFFSGALLSYIFALPMLLSYIGPAYAGSAGGFLSTFQTGGGFVLPFLFPVMANGRLLDIFYLVVVGFALMALAALPVPELIKRK